MEILRATIRNLGPYYGKQEIELAAGERPVTLVHGDNMRGKTSLLRAIRWAMYGAARARGGEALPAFKLLNTDAADDGTFEFSVELEIRDGLDTYVLTRQAQSTHRPTKDSDLEVTTHLRRNEHFLPADETRTAINRLLPEDVSHFFLFDGEMLNDFEDLLSDAVHQADAIRRSIEQILGVPSVENSVEDVQQLLGEAQKKRDKAAQNVKAAEKDAERAQSLAAAIATVESDIGDLDQRHADARAQIAVIDESLKAYEQIKTEFELLGEWRERKTTADTRIEELREERRLALEPAWRDILVSAIAPRLDGLEQHRDELTLATQRAATLQSQRETLEKAIANAADCPTCGQRIGDEEARRMQAVLDGLPVEDVPDPAELESTVASISRLRRIKNVGVVAKITTIESDIRRQTVERAKATNRITEIETKLRDHDVADVSRTQKERDRLTKHEGGIEQELSDARDRLATLNAEAAQVRHRISQISDPQLDRLNREVELYEGLLEVFQEALAELRDELKVAVEKDATEIFKQLTTDPAYTGLKITDSYGLYILDASGKEVFVRSAGAEQVVALSLIGALNRNAVKRGPVIMDTPFGRLDPRHRANILRFLPTMADQVVLLVHGGEVDRERDLETVAPFVERQYELSYVSSVRTAIVPMGAKVS